jgi:hypothetical protein
MHSDAYKEESKEINKKKLCFEIQTTKVTSNRRLKFQLAASVFCIGLPFDVK